MWGRCESDGRGVVVHTEGDHTDSTWIRALDGSPLVADADIALITLLLPAMRTGEALRIDGEVSASLLETVAHVRDVFCTWDRFLRPSDRWYHPVEVTAPTRSDAGGRAEATACLFTGGVDSFHTAITQAHRIDALVYVHGFDVRLDDEPLRATVTEHLRAAAQGLGLPLVEMESDLQLFGDRRWVGWDDFHGAALAAVGTALSGRFGRLLVPATHTYAHLEGLGSHPLVDPWWSGDRVRIEHVGAASTRVDKIRVLDHEPVARRHLRVCWENRRGRYNCGTCEKCVRTGVAVRLAGAEGHFPTIPPPSLRQIASVEVTGRGAPWHELRNESTAQGTAPRLRRAMDIALARHQLRRWRFTRRLRP